MSFILDALRKSESERQMEAVPQVMRVPLSVGKNRVPGWAVATIFALATLLIAAVGGFWWFGVESGAEPPLAETERIDPPGAAARADAPEPPGLPLETELTPAPAITVLQPPPVVAEPIDGPQADTAAVEPTSEPVAAPVSADRPGPAESAAPEILPTFLELLADGVSVPMLRVDLHVMGASSADRFVYINGARYIEGDTLTEGPEVLAITADGVVLAHAGRRFLLSKN